MIGKFRLPTGTVSAEKRQLFDALETNARRLLADARILFEAKSYASAQSLAVLSIEETGKFWIVAFCCLQHGQDELAKAMTAELRSHPFKQLHAMLIVTSISFRESVRELLTLHGKDRITVDKFIATHYAVKSEPDAYPHLVEVSKKFDIELERLARDWMHKSGLLNLLDNISFGEIDKSKQNGFYVDFDPATDRLLNDPAKVDRVQAEYYILLAEWACYGYLRDDPPASSFAREATEARIDR